MQAQQIPKFPQMYAMLPQAYNIQPLAVAMIPENFSNGFYQFSPFQAMTGIQPPSRGNPVTNSSSEGNTLTSDSNPSDTTNPNTFTNNILKQTNTAMESQALNMLQWARFIVMAGGMASSSALDMPGQHALAGLMESQARTAMNPVSGSLDLLKETNTAGLVDSGNKRKVVDGIDVPLISKKGKAVKELIERSCEEEMMKSIVQSGSDSE
ncbi:hypothetical protein HK096_008891 [Nowakowskiella sp. JEL0078]|nr:hypothetical protein HK096_008891 [Nowakowskiella sp. JEL0078]